MTLIIINIIIIVIIIIIIIISNRLGCKSKAVNQVWRIIDAQVAQNDSSERKYTEEKITVLTLKNTDI